MEKSLLDPYWQDEVGETVATAVQPYGYYNSETKVSIEEGDKVTVNVALNAPLTINKVTREIIGAGREDKAFRERFNSLKLKEGDVLNQTIYESFKRPCLTTPYLMAILIILAGDASRPVTKNKQTYF